MPNNAQKDWIEMNAEDDRAALAEECKILVGEYGSEIFDDTLVFYSTPGGRSHDPSPRVKTRRDRLHAAIDRLRDAAPAPTIQPKREPLYLVMAGGDGFQANIVPESQLDDAYLLTQWCTLGDIDPQERAAALENFHDDDSWMHTEVTDRGNDRVQFYLNLEDGWIQVTRLPALQAQPPIEVPSVREALTELVALKDLEHRTNALHFAGAHGQSGEGWYAEYEAGRKDYIKRQPLAWDAAKAALQAQPAAAPAPTNEAPAERCAYCGVLTKNPCEVSPPDICETALLASIPQRRVT